MYCPACGNPVKKELKFCNSCGARLSSLQEDRDGTPGKMLDNILTTLFLVVMFGLGILVGLVAVLLGNDVPTRIVTVIVLAYLGAVFGICYMLAQQVPKLIDAKLQWNNVSQPQEAPRELRPVTTAQLEEYRQPAMSVTDSTTRALDSVPRQER